MADVDEAIGILDGASWSSASNRLRFISIRSGPFSCIKSAPLRAETRSQ